MALTDKNIVITPNVGQSADPQVVFSGADATTGPQSITLRVYPTDGGTISFEGSAGQLFSLTNSLSGTIYSVNDVSGIPSIEVLDTGLVKLAEYGGNVLIGTGTDNGVDLLQVDGSVTSTVLKSTVAVGTAPLTVTSTTVVTNLNADLLDGQEGSYYLDWTNVTNKPDPQITVTLTGDVTGTANTTLTDLASGTVSVATTIAANSVALGTDTTGTYVVSLTAGTGITITGTAGEGWSPTVTNSAPNVTTDISITHAATNVTVNSSDGTDGTINAATTSLAGVMTAADKTKLDGIATGAEVNQNAFSNVAVSGQTTVAADAKTDTLTLVAGSAITITTDATGDSVTIAHTDTSSQASVDNSNGTVIQDITLDGSGHITAIGSVDLDPRYLNTDGDTLTGPLTVSATGNIIYSDTGGTYIPRPQNATYKTATSAVTGAVTIQLPTTLWANINDMISFWVDIYDYSTNESVSIFVYGYAYGSSTGQWANAGATILTPRTDRDYNVRFGHDGTRHLVCIGEIDTVWSYPQIVVRDFQAGYTAVPANLDDGWAITFLTTLPTVGITSSGNTVVAKQLQTARTISLTGDVTGSTTFDGSANVSISATIAANSVALGTDTTGTYVVSLTAGTGITITGTAGEGWSPTVTNSAPNVTTDISITHAATNVTVNSSDGADGTINAATTSLAGVMTAADKTKLDGIAAGATTNTGTVTSVAGTGTVSGLTLSGTVTTSGNLTLGGTLAVAPSNFSSQTANTVLIAPNGSAGVPTFRALVSADIPTLNQNTTGNAATATVLQTARTINGVSFNGSANITVQDSTKLPLAGGALTGSLHEARIAITSTIDLNAGNYFTKTVTGATSFLITNTPSSGTVANFILDLINGGSQTISWWGNLKWAGGGAPTLTVSGRDVLGFFTHDGGSTWTGLILGKDIK